MLYPQLALTLCILAGAYQLWLSYGFILGYIGFLIYSSFRVFVSVYLAPFGVPFG